MKTYEHIIWDWNGTLFDDAWLCLEIINGLLDKYSLSRLSHEQYQEVFDFPVRTYYERLGFDFETHPFEKVATEFIAGYQRRRFECALQAGAREILDCIQRTGCSQSVLSAYPHARLLEIIDHFELGGYFSAIAGLSDHYAAGKAAIGALHLENLDIAPRQVLMIGDTLHDAEVARQLGVDCVCIPSGHHPRHRLSVCGVPVLTSLDDIRGLTGSRTHPTPDSRSARLQGA